MFKRKKYLILKVKNMNELPNSSISLFIREKKTSSALRNFFSGNTALSQVTFSKVLIRDQCSEKQREEFSNVILDKPESEFSFSFSFKHTS